MRAGQVAENIINGNFPDAREGLLSGRSRVDALVRLLDVIEDLADMSENGHFEDLQVAIDRLRRLLG